MRRGVSFLLIGFVTGFALSATTLFAREAPSWTQLSHATCAVDDFLAAHPHSDGRGVVIAILDTGVDPSIPGLTHTPDGAVKVIDVQDFSGEGDTDMHRVRRDPATGKVVDYAKDGAAIEYALPELNGGEERRFWFGWLEEKKFVNDDVSDLNDNGRTDDRFPFLVTALDSDGDDQALLYLDTNLNRSFADEKPVGNYRLRYETFTLARAKPEAQIVPLTFAVNVFLRKSKVVFHFDDGAHGTHVAGIAAGYRINNQEGFNGIAPGAKVISLKIGQNAIGGISTTDAKKRALRYAARFAREHGVPVVCNLSYGVMSTIEGHSAIDRFVNQHLRKNPYLVFCTSAGNEGPGVSSIGTPAAAAEAITVGALLAADSGRDVQGFTMQGPVVTLFSSRGGELAKPDIATPGWSTSTVPRWVQRGDYWAGTSMASPYATGLCALLLSDTAQRHPQTPVRASLVKRALQLSAQPLPGATVLDYGYGVPQIGKAAEILENLLAHAANDPVLSYEISTPCAFGYQGRAPAAYWRSTYTPGAERQAFRITPVFAPGIDEARRTGFTRKFELRSRASWCALSQETVYLRSAQSATVYVEYDATQLTEPGLHVGVVEALCDGVVAFRLLNTVIVPHRVDGDTNFTYRAANQETAGWFPQRYFLAVPPGASAMRATLRAPEGAASKASVARIFDPSGFRLRNRGNHLDTEKGKREAVWTLTDKLVPGVWEIDVVSDRPDRNWPYDLTVRFFGLHAQPKVVTECDSPLEKPSGRITVTNLFETPVFADARGMIEGFRTRHEDTFKGLNDELTYDVKLTEADAALRLDLKLQREAFAETTDIGVSVETEDGKAIFSSAFDNHKFTARVPHPEPGTTVSLTVRIHAGFAISDDQRKTPIEVNLDHLLANPVELEVTRDEKSQIVFLPAVPIALDFATAQTLPQAPDKTSPVGYITLTERGSHDEALRVPLRLEN